MANRLQLRRGTSAPGGIFYEGEPVYDKTNKVLYVGDANASGSGNGSAVASASAYGAVAEMLNQASSAAPGSIRLYEDTDNGTNYVAVAASTLIGSNYTLTLPNGTGTDGQVLKTDGSGNLDWVSQTSGFSGFSITDGSNTETITSGNTILFEAGEGIDAVVSSTDTLTISAEDATDSNKGIASFDSGDFGVSSGDVTLADTVVKTVTTDSGALTPSSHGLSILGGEGMNVTHSSTTISVAGEDASDSNKGIASFDSGDFSVSSGNVTLADSANGAVLAISGTTNEVEVSRSNGTVTVGLPDDVTIGNDLTVNGNLNVVGTAVTFSAETTRIEDRILELGLVNGAAPGSATTWDLAVSFNYNSSGAKKAGVAWLNNGFMAMLSELAESSDTGNADPQITATAYAKIAGDSLYLGGIASSNEIINSSGEAQNLIFDGGTY